MRVVSYNSRGLRVGHTAADKARRLVVDTLLEDCDVLCIQESWLAKQDLDKLIKLHWFLKFDEGYIIDSATTDRFFIRGMNENSFDLSFGVRFNVPENVSFSIEKNSEIFHTIHPGAVMLI